MVPFSNLPNCRSRSSSEPSKATSVERRKVSARDLRDRFNAGEYIARLEAGEFTWCCVDRSKRPASVGEPAGAESLCLAGLDALGHRIFVVHCYIRPGGEVGGSGLHDPKWLFEDGVIYWTP